MPQENNAQPNAPLLRDGGYASSALVGYFNQLDMIESRRLMGRWTDAGVGPWQWVELGSGLDLSDDGTLTSTGLGGDVVGPASSTDSVLAAWDGTTGALLKDSTVLAAWFNQAVTSASSPAFVGLSVNGFAFTVGGAPTLNDWFNQSVKSTASPSFNGLAVVAISVNGKLFTVNGPPTLDDWFDQSVKTTASPTFNVATLTGLSVNGFTVTVSGATTLNNWFDQSVKVAASPQFVAVRTTAKVRADTGFNFNGTDGDTFTGLSVALNGGGTNLAFNIKGGIITDGVLTP